MTYHSATVIHLVIPTYYQHSLFIVHHRGNLGLDAVSSLTHMGVGLSPLPLLEVGASSNVCSMAVSTVCVEVQVLRERLTDLSTPAWYVGGRQGFVPKWDGVI